MRFRVAVDRIEEGTAVLLPVGEAAASAGPAARFLWPRALLPVETREGAHLVVSVEVDPESTAEAAERVRGLLERLREPSGGAPTGRSRGPRGGWRAMTAAAHVRRCASDSRVGRLRWAGLTLVLLVCLGAAGCVGGPDTLITSPVEVTFWHGQEGEAAALLEELAREFSASHPLVKITPVYRGDPEAVARDLLAVPVVGRPVMAEVDERWLSALREGGAIRPLSGFVKSKSYGLRVEDLSDFWPCFVASNTTGRREVWGLPFSHKVYALVYNPALVLSPPVTWDELKVQATVLTRRHPDPSRSVFGLALRLDADLFTLFLHQAGGRLLAGEPPRWSFNTPEGIASIEYFYELTTLRKAALLTLGDPLEAVVDGQAAMAVAKVGWPPGVLPSGSLAVAPLPSGATRATLAPGTSLVLVAGRTPAEEEAAWRFARWLTGPSCAARWAAGTGDVPVRKSAADQTVWREAAGSLPGWPEVLATMDSVVVLPVVANWSETREELAAAMEVYLLGQRNCSKAVLDEVALAANRALASP